MNHCGTVSYNQSTVVNIRLALKEASCLMSFLNAKTHSLAYCFAYVTVLGMEELLLNATSDVGSRATPLQCPLFTPAAALAWPEVARKEAFATSATL